MRSILVTGGTVFVSRFIAEHFVALGDDVYVLNRNTREQSAGVHLIKADRHDLADSLRHIHFDAVIDTGYTAKDVKLLLNGMGSYGNYVFISSSAVYPADALRPFREETPLSENKYWGAYGTNKIEAETVLLQRDPHAYVLRPPYLYGPMNNVYREAFVFDCAMADRSFYLPKDGEMQLQFFHIRDLCRFIEILLERNPSQHIFNVGNRETVSVRNWVECCYRIAGKQVELVPVHDTIEQRNYFPFYDYEYSLDVTRQHKWMPDTTPLTEGLAECFTWYRNHQWEVNKKPLFDYIDHQLAK